MIATIIIIAVLVCYSGFVLSRKLRQNRQRWKNGCSGNCGNCRKSCGEEK